MNLVIITFIVCAAVVVMRPIAGHFAYKWSIFFERPDFMDWAVGWVLAFIAVPLAPFVVLSMLAGRFLSIGAEREVRESQKIERLEQEKRANQQRIARLEKELDLVNKE